MEGGGRVRMWLQSSELLREMRTIYSGEVAAGVCVVAKIANIFDRCGRFKRETVECVIWRPPCGGRGRRRRQIEPSRFAVKPDLAQDVADIPGDMLSANSERGLFGVDLSLIRLVRF